MMRFTDRTEAGRRLGEELAVHDLDDALVLGLPRGGVPVAAEVAGVLDAPLDVLVVRKIGAPRNPEFAVGAIGEGGAEFIDTSILDRMGLSRDDLQGTIAAERDELRRRVEAYRGDAAPLDVAGRTVVVVDDGMATGASARVAVQVLRELAPARTVLAVPVASTAAVDRLDEVVDDVVVLSAPRDFLAVGAHYDDFGQTSDREVTELLSSARRPQ
ncbi:MAG: phosphoribosyltransferase [Actinobacteria bacterium]|nr:phosphoribosyltransferase [Actinomycetota bacterium]